MLVFDPRQRQTGLASPLADEQIHQGTCTWPKSNASSCSAPPLATAAHRSACSQSTYACCCTLYLPSRWLALISGPFSPLWP